MDYIVKFYENILVWNLAWGISCARWDRLAASLTESKQAHEQKQRERLPGEDRMNQLHCRLPTSMLRDRSCERK